MSEESLRSTASSRHAPTRDGAIPRVLLRAAADIFVITAAGILLFAWFSRLKSGDSLAETITSHGLIPAAVAGQAAAFVIVGELVLGVASLWLVCGKRRTRLAAGWLGGAAMMFALYAGLLIIMPPEQPTSCGCGLSGSDIANRDAIAIRNSVAAFSLFMAATVAAK